MKIDPNTGVWTYGPDDPEFYQQFNVQMIQGKAYPWQVGRPADIQGMNAALAAEGRSPAPVASEVEVAQAADPNGPGNNEGGSDFANIAKVLGFVGGGAGLLNSLGGGVAGADAACHRADCDCTEYAE